MNQARVLYKFQNLILLIVATALPAVAARAQSNEALIDILVRKGIITLAEARQVQTEVATQTASAPVVTAGKTTVGGRLFFDVTSVDAKTAAGTETGISGVGADVKRLYVQVDHDFNPRWKASIKSDASYSSSTGTTALFIKTAYLEARFSPEAMVQLGAADMPWIPFADGLYGLRYVENTLIDRMQVGNSADWGVHFLGRNGMVSYNFAAVNGGGHRNPSRSQSLDFEGRVSFESIAGFTAAIGGYRGRLGKDVAGGGPTRDATRLNALLAYTGSHLRVGAEYFSEDNWGRTSGALTDTGDGSSVWATVKVGGPYSVFARYDRTKPSKVISPDMRQDYFNAGVQWAAAKGLDLALAYKSTTVDNPPSASTVTQADEFGLFAQAAF
jgi:hypothetical protein